MEGFACIQAFYLTHIFAYVNCRLIEYKTNVGHGSRLTWVENSSIIKCVRKTLPEADIVILKLGESQHMQNLSSRILIKLNWVQV